MRYERMVNTLAENESVRPEEAERVLTATVQALRETAPAEMRDLASQLPNELSDVAADGADPRRSLDEFVVRIGDLTAIEDLQRARAATSAAFRMITAAISAGQVRQLMESLPTDFGDLAPSETGLDGHSEALLAYVRGGTGAESLEQARELTTAVLRVFAENLSTGEADDLAAALPEGISAALRDVGATHWQRDTHRGPAQSNRDDFLAAVNEAATVTNSDRVYDDTAAVLAVLTEWAPDEMGKALDQLPKEIARLNE